MTIEDPIGNELLIYREEGAQGPSYQAGVGFRLQASEEVSETDLMERFQLSPDEAIDLLQAARTELQEHGLLTTPHRSTRRALLAASIALLVAPSRRCRQRLSNRLRPTGRYGFCR